MTKQLQVGRGEAVTLYVSGPMTGIEGHNYRAFRQAAKQLTEEGYNVIDPSENFGGATDLPRHEYMRKDIEHVLAADGIALLSGWVNSEGAKLEVQVAQELGIPIHPVADWVLFTDMYGAGPERGRVLNAGGREYRYAWDGTLTSDSLTTTKREPLPQTILEEAQHLVHGDRGAAYGHPADDFGRTAGYWNVTFKDKLRPGASFEAADVPLALIGVKLSREVNKPKRDNMTDLAGYAETRRMVLEREGRG